MATKIIIDSASDIEKEEAELPLNLLIIKLLLLIML